MSFESDILARVKKRLYGDQADTQVIPDFSSSILFAPEKSEEIQHTQPLHGAALVLPQLLPDDAEFAQQSAIPTQLTQKVHHVGHDIQHTVESTQKVDSDAPTQVIGNPEEELSREERLAALIEKKRQERLAAEAALEAEISHTTLTDEEQDLEADRTLDSSVQKNVTTKKELEQIERFLSEQKRTKSIQPVFEKRNTNPVQQLLSAFDSDSETEPLGSEPALKLSPTTSPVKTVGKEIDSDDDIDFDTSNVLDLITNPQKPHSPKKTNPIESYAQKLKKQILSSPTNAKEAVIMLDDTDDERGPGDQKDEIPILKKEQQFLIKQKFSKKRFMKEKKILYSKHHHPAKSEALFDALRRANAKQLLELREADPDAGLLDEIEREEEEMGNLLEREMERVRRIRQKEKLQAKALEASLNREEDDEDYEDNPVNESEVPDSDNSFNSGSDMSDDEDENDGGTSVPKTNRRIILSDDEDEMSSSAEKDQSTVIPDSIARRESVDQRHDDSYMFGGVKEQGVESDEEVLRIQSDYQGSSSPSRGPIEDNVKDDGMNLYKLFLNLAPRRESLLSANNSIVEESVVLEAPSFQDLPASQNTLDLDNVLPTQVDTQPIDDVEPAEAYSDDEDADLPNALRRGRKLISKNSLASLAEEDEDSEMDEGQKEEMLKEKLALFEAKIRKKELKARKMRKDMERKGFKSIVEGEAEESDDEWKGVGGADAEDSDQANSEDERMIDNNFNIDLNDEEVRKKFMEQYQIKDRKDLEKLMDDIKNHRLTKRARTNRFDIELSDEEDEILMAYRRQKLEEQKKRLLANSKLMKLSNSEKSQAFFESMQEEVVSVILDDEEDDVSEQDADAQGDTEENGDTQTDQDSAPAKKSIRIEESFVLKQLSFLSKTEDDDYYAIQKASDAQHGLEADESIEDISTLKHRCLSNLFSRSQTPQSIEESTRKRPADEILTNDDEDADDDFSHVFKKPSVVNSFRSFQEKQGVQVSTKSFKGVTVNKQYKVASGGKASITYMSKASKSKLLVAPKFKSSRAKHIEESVDKAKLDHRNSIFGSGSSFA